MVFRSTDLVRPETIEQSRIHKEWESRIDVFYTATACIAADDILYGTISLMRSKDHGDFSDEEVNVLDSVNQHLCNRFRLTYPNGVNRLMVDSSVDPIAAEFSLTPREWEITCMLMQGCSRSNIAERLCISINTLKKHVSNIYRKMGVNNTRQFFAEIDKAERTLHSGKSSGGSQRKAKGLHLQEKAASTLNQMSRAGRFILFRGAYRWICVPEIPAIASAAFSSDPMMQTRPARDSANFIAALTFGSMDPLPNWSSAR